MERSSLKAAGKKLFICGTNDSVIKRMVSVGYALRLLKNNNAVIDNGVIIAL